MGMGFEAGNLFALRRRLRLLAGDLGFQPLRIQHGQQLARFDAVAFLHEQRGNPLAAVEGQLDLADVHVAVEHHAIGGLGPAATAPKPESGDDGGEDDNSNQDANAFHI